MRKLALSILAVATLTLPSCNNVYYGTAATVGAGFANLIDLGVTTSDTPQFNIAFCVIVLPIFIGGDFDGVATGLLGGKLVTAEPMKCHYADHAYT